VASLYIGEDWGVGTSARARVLVGDWEDVRATAYGALYIHTATLSNRQFRPVASRSHVFSCFQTAKTLNLRFNKKNSKCHLRLYKIKSKKLQFSRVVQTISSSIITETVECRNKSHTCKSIKVYA
jgi:hypothetical protein